MWGFEQELHLCERIEREVTKLADSSVTQGWPSKPFIWCDI